MTSKSRKRKEYLLEIMDILRSENIYDTIDYCRQDEGKIKQFIYPYLVEALTNHYAKGHTKKDIDIARQKARKNILWEGNKKTTVNNIVVFGVQHRPDMVIKDDDISIAIEIKKGDNGSDIRGGIGQSLIYSTTYDFVLYLFIDTSADKKILNSYNSEKESNLSIGLWDNYNIMFNIV